MLEAIQNCKVLQLPLVVEVLVQLFPSKLDLGYLIITQAGVEELLTRSGKDSLSTWWVLASSVS